MQGRVLIAFAVHLLTLSGLLLALAAMFAASQQAWTAMFAFLGLALIVDGLDGPLARRFDVAAVLPRWQGAVMDLIVDYLTYVFIPAFAVLTAQIMPPVASAIAAGAICVSAGFYFADRQMKTEDHFFRGFPAVWNVAVFYLLAFGVNGIAALSLVVFFSVLSFAPVEFVHPLRVRRLRGLTLAVTAAWGLLAIAALLQDLAPGFALRLGLGACAAYFLLVCIWRSSPLWPRGRR